MADTDTRPSSEATDTEQIIVAEDSLLTYIAKQGEQFDTRAGQLVQVVQDHRSVAKNLRHWFEIEYLVKYLSLPVEERERDGAFLEALQKAADVLSEELGPEDANIVQDPNLDGSKVNAIPNDVICAHAAVRCQNITVVMWVVRPFQTFLNHSSVRW